MNKNIKVSVIVPIYNVEHYLKRCLESLVNQTLQDFQLILVNDGSTDSSQQIIDEYKKIYPEKIIALIKDNGGLSDARNFGLSYAKGEYIAFVDSDDYVDHTFLEKMYNKAITTQSEVVVCGYYAIDEYENTMQWMQQGYMNDFGHSVKEKPELIYKNAPFAWNKLFHSRLFQKLNIEFPKGLLYEDIPTCYPLLACANKISKVNEPLVYYILKRKGSITGTYSMNMLQMFDSLSLLNKRFKDLHIDDQYVNELLFLNLRHLFFRFEEFQKYSYIKLKLLFVYQGFHFLNENFPHWRDYDLFFETFYSEYPTKKKLIKYSLYWYILVFIPHCFYDSFSLFLKKKEAFSFDEVKQKVIKKRKYFKKHNYLKWYYAFHVKYSKVCPSLVLFESFHGKTLSGSPFYMMKDLTKYDTSKTIYFATRHFQQDLDFIKRNHLNIQLVRYESFQYVKILATAKYLVNNVSFPLYFKRRVDQKYLNTWHGTPLKTLGKKMNKNRDALYNIQKNFLQSTDLLFSNQMTMDCIMEDYNLKHLYTGNVVLSGLPRNSIFFDCEDAFSLKKELGLENKEVFAYMPTWRTGCYFSLEQVEHVLYELDSVLKDHQIMYVHFHSLTCLDVQFQQFKHILPFPNIDNYKFLNCVDVLVTDYSSVMFDFAIKNKPIVLFMPDYESYGLNRGLYFDVNTLPFIKIYDLEHLKRYLANFSMAFVHYQLLDILKYDNKNAAHLLNQYFFNGVSDHIDVIDYSFNKDIKRTLVLAPEIMKKSDLLKLKNIKQYSHPVILFLKSQMTPLLQKELDLQFQQSDYLIVRTKIAYTFMEILSMHFLKLLKNKKYLNYYSRILEYILPNIAVERTVLKDNSAPIFKKIYKRFEKGTD